MPQTPPLPPASLRYRVTGSEDAEWFDRSGRMSLADLTRGLAAVGRTFEDFHTMLEWGCGCGRILRQLPQPQAPRRLFGFDIDAEAIAWVAQNLPWVETSRTEGLPPLRYADNSFDLIFNHSVMSHLDATYQDLWLAELRRLLHPGGILILTTHGLHAFRQALDALGVAGAERTAQIAALRRNGLVFRAAPEWKGIFPDYYQSAFHDVHYIFEHWARFFEIRCYVARGALDYQDLVVMQRRNDAEEAAAAEYLAASAPLDGRRQKLRRGWGLMREALRRKP